MMDFRYELNYYAAGGEGAEGEPGIIRVRSEEGLLRILQGENEQERQGFVPATAATAAENPISGFATAESSSKKKTAPRKDSKDHEVADEGDEDNQDHWLLEASGWSVVSCDDHLDGCPDDRKELALTKADSSVTLGEIELTGPHGTGTESTTSSLGASGLYTNPPSKPQERKARTGEDDDDEPLSVPGTNSLPTDLRSLEQRLHQDCNVFVKQPAASPEGAVSATASQAENAKERLIPDKKRSNFSTLHLLLACTLTFALTSWCFLLWDHQTWRMTARDLERVLKDREEELVMARLQREEDGRLSPTYCMPSDLLLPDENSTQTMSSISVDTCWFKGQVSMSLGSCANETAHGILEVADYLWGWSKSFWDSQPPHATVSTGGMYSTAGVTLASLRQLGLAIAELLAEAPTPTNLAEKWYASRLSSSS